MNLRIFKCPLILCATITCCTATAPKKPATLDPVPSGASQNQAIQPIQASPPSTKSWTDPQTNTQYFFLGMGSFDTWAEDCKKFAPNLKPLIMDVNFSRVIAVELLTSEMGSVFNSEEVKGSEIIEGRVIAYKLSTLQDSQCRVYPKGVGGGRLPAFFVPSSSLSRELSEKDLLSRSYSCNLSPREAFPVARICANK